MLLSLYKAMMHASTPVLEAYLQKRAAAGKEDPARANERRGVPLRDRPDGKLVWLHAASVGESLSLLALIERLLKDYADIHIMVTTGTVTSARLMAERLPVRAFHQYVPVDHPAWVRRFLDHWRPDAVLWAESEFWPNMLAEIKTRGIPAVLLNARMSPESFARWRWAGGAIGGILGAFDLCLGQDAAEAERLSRLGARQTKVSTNLKYAAAPLPYDSEKLAALQQEVGGRPCLLWASTHPGEEAVAARAHNSLSQEFPDLVTIIVPRHPVRGAEIAEEFSAALRSRGDKVNGLYIADTLGELGIFYRLCRIAVMGGSFVDIGGHNPIEPAQLGCAVIFGPHDYNFTAILADFRAENAVIQATPQNVRKTLAIALANPGVPAGVARAAENLTRRKATVLDDIMRDISPSIRKAGTT